VAAAAATAEAKAKLSEYRQAIKTKFFRVSSFY
jgi:hypothetical protein